MPLEDQQTYYRIPATSPAFTTSGSEEGMEQPLSHGQKSLTSGLTFKRLLLSGVNIGRSLNGIPIREEDLIFGSVMVVIGGSFLYGFGKTNMTDSLLISSSQILFGFLTSI